MSGLSDSQAAQKLTAYFRSNFSASGVDVAFDNEPSITRTNPFVRMDVLIGESAPNLDSSWERVTGIVVLRSFVPVGSGDVPAWAQAEAAANVLKYKTIDVIRLTSADMQNLGDSGTEWHRIDVKVPFFFERVTS